MRNNLVPAELVALARIVNSMMAILNARLFTLAALGICAWLFGWVMYDPHWIRFASAVAFSILVFFPIQRMENIRIAKTQENEHE